MEDDFRTPRIPQIRLHSRTCVICHHPQRAEIEEAFVHWDHPAEIVEKYGLSHRSLLYRHARARHLYEARATHLRSALDHIVERASTVPITANTVVSAVRAYAHINTKGKWEDPPRKIIFAKEEPVDRDVKFYMAPSLYEAHLNHRDAMEKAKADEAAAAEKAKSESSPKVISPAEQAELERIRGEQASMERVLAREAAERAAKKPPPRVPRVTLGSGSW